MKAKWKLLTLIFLITSLFSCFDADLINPDKIDTENILWQPDMTLPIVNVDITLGDLLGDNLEDQEIVVEGGMYVIKHLEENISSIMVSEVLDFPSSTIPVKASPIAIPDEIKDLGYISTELLSSSQIILGSTSAVIEIVVNKDDDNNEIVLKSLKSDFYLNVDLSPQPFAYSIKIEFPGNTNLNREIIVNANESPQSIDFTDSEIKFDINNPDKINKMDVETTISILRKNLDGDYYNIDFGSLSPLALSFSLSNFAFKKAVGDFGNMKVDIPSGSFPMDMGDMSDVTGFQFKNPYIKMIIHNHNMGIGFNLDMDLKSTSKSNPVPVSIKKPDAIDFFVFGPISEQVEGEYKLNNIKFDSNNSNIEAFMNNFPFENISYAGSFNLIPNQDAEGEEVDSFVSSDANMIIDAEMTIPLNFSTGTDGLKYTYEIKDVDFGIDTKTKNKIESAKLIFKARNGWPLGIKLEKISFKDSLNNELASVVGEVLSNSIIGPDGTVAEINDKTPFVTNQIGINIDVINILDKVKNIDLVLQLKVGNEANTVGKFTPKERLNLILGLQAKFDLSKSSNN